MAAPKNKPTDPVETTEIIEAAAGVPVEKINEKAAQLRMAAKYRQEELVEVSISPLYANEFSRNMPIILNGIRVDVPVNGQIYKVPYSFALEVKHRIALADTKFKRLNRMADISNNIERSPGELKLFR